MSDRPDPKTGTPPAELVGARIAHFVITERLGKGGMGEVYRATDTDLQRDVALKVLPRNLAGDPGRRARLVREARHAAAVSHPNIAVVYEVGESDGRVYVAMEHVRGQTLARILRDGPLTMEKVISIAQSIAHGLAAAHERGIVHRDLKPQNVMVNEDGLVKLLDFGLARPAARSAQPVIADDDTAFATAEGAILGTPAYMSPEQCRGQAADVRSDVFAFGIVLYELVCGERPFVGDFAAEVGVAILRDDPIPLASKNRAVPADLARIANRCLQKRPEDRYETGAQLASELERVGTNIATAPASDAVSVTMTDAAARAPITNLAADVTRFVGRGDDLEQLQELSSEGARLVTILGPPGMGKTRLAREHGMRCLDDLPGPDQSGVWFCDLTAARSIDDLCGGLARVLGIALSSADPVQQLGRALGARKNLLVILDNFEQIAEQASATVARWLEGTQSARFLVTSRERLRIAGEIVLALEPLSFPDGEVGDAAEAAPFDAISLFAERVRAVRPDYEVTDADAAAVAEIVRSLDGIPLAIELAAARATIMNPTDMRARLGDRFRLLRGSQRGQSDRHQTLRKAIDWSWELLSPSEKAALCQCSVFRGGFSLDAAEAVVAIGDADDLEIMDVLESLVDKSLVRSTRTADTEVPVRFALYESIREYAAHRLCESGDEDACVGRHVRQFGKLGTRWIGGEYGPEGPRLWRDVDTESENLAAAVDRTLRRPLASSTLTAAALHAGIALGAVFERRGPAAAGLKLFHALLDACGDSEVDALLQARVRCRSYPFLHTTGRLDEALHHLEEGAKRARGRSAGVLVEALCLRSVVLMNSGRLGEAWALLEDAKAASAHLAKDAWQRGLLMMLLASRKHEQGDFVGAAEVYRESLVVPRQIGDLRTTGNCLANLGYLQMDRGDLGAAGESLEESLALGERYQYSRSQANRLLGLGEVKLQAGSLSDARSCFERAVKLLRDGGTATWALPSAGIARCYQEEGDLDTAQRIYDESLTELDDGLHLAEGEVLAYRACACQEQGRLSDARAAFERALHTLVECGTARSICLIRACASALYARIGSLERASSSLQQAERETVPDTIMPAVVELAEASLDLARAEACEHGADARAACIAAARSRIAAAERDVMPGVDPEDGPLVARSWFARFLIRTLNPWLAELEGGE